jgi:hypothetical protein
VASDQWPVKQLAVSGFQFLVEKLDLVVPARNRQKFSGLEIIVILGNGAGLPRE